MALLAKGTARWFYLQANPAVLAAATKTLPPDLTTEEVDDTLHYNWFCGRCQRAILDDMLPYTSAEREADLVRLEFMTRRPRVELTECDCCEKTTETEQHENSAAPWLTVRDPTIGTIGMWLCEADSKYLAKNRRLQTKDDIRQTDGIPLDIALAKPCLPG
jgi:hypothetical protein